MPDPRAADEAPRPARLWLKVATLLLLVAIVAWAAATLDWHALGRAFLRTRPSLIVLAAMANAAAIYVQSMRWRALLRPLAQVRRPVAFTALTLGFALSTLLPARLGELARIEHLARRTVLSRASVTGSIVLDHVVNGLTFAPMLVPLALFSGLPTWARRGVDLLLLVAVALAVAAFVFATQAHAPEPGGRVRQRLAQLREGLAAARSPRPFIDAMAWGLVSWLLEATTAALALRAFHVDATWMVALLVLCAVNVALAVPSPPANIGTFELGAALALTAVGVPQAVAVAFALGYHALQLGSVWLLALAVWPTLAAKESR